MRSLSLERSGTPLTRAHLKDVGRSRGRSKRAVSASKRDVAFDRAAYPKAALELAASAQESLAIGEFIAVDLFARLTAALTTVGAPLDIVSACARVPVDEARHAELALQMARAMGASAEPLVIDPLRHEHHVAMIDQAAQPGRWSELDCAMLELPALGETLACALIARSRDIARDASVRSHFEALLSDEIHHARLGWHYLAWRAPSWTVAERQAAADHAGRFVVEMERMFLRGRDAPVGAKKAARALGVLDTAEQRDAVERAMIDEILPGLDGLGLGGSLAWAHRKRVWG